LRVRSSEGLARTAPSRSPTESRATRPASLRPAQRLSPRPKTHTASTTTAARLLSTPAASTPSCSGSCCPSARTMPPTEFRHSDSHAAVRRPPKDGRPAPDRPSLAGDAAALPSGARTHVESRTGRPEAVATSRSGRDDCFARRRSPSARLQRQCDWRGLHLCGLTLKLSGAQRHGAVPARRRITMSASRAQCHAVARPLERPVRPSPTTKPHCLQAEDLA
jgi:hypothetical protein